MLQGVISQLLHMLKYLEIDSPVFVFPFVWKARRNSTALVKVSIRTGWIERSQMLHKNHSVFYILRKQNKILLGK